MSDVQNMTIRFANKTDIALILTFIKGLAEYERMPDEVVATEASLQQTLFGNHKVAEVILGFVAEQPVGFALFFHNYSTFLGRPGIYLEDLFINPEMRGKGYGKALLSYLAQIAIDRKCGRLEWSVLNWNEPAIKFYKKLGAKARNGWTVYRVTDDPLDQLAQEGSY